MTIIIDGYNLLKQREPHGYISEEQRSLLLNQLRSYAVKRGHDIVLMFDGGSMPWISREHQNGILVIYSGWQITADDAIKEYIDEYSARDLLLVSSDAELCRWASERSVASIDAHYFWIIVEDVIKHEPKKDTAEPSIVKTTKRVDEALDAIMREAAETVYDKDKTTRVRNHARKRLPRTSSKKDRLLKKKLDKL